MSPALFAGQRFSRDDATGGIHLSSASGIANVKGAYAEIEAAIPFEAQGLYVMMGPSTGQGDVLFDLAVGAAAAEQIFWPNLQFSEHGLSNAHVYAPLHLPSGLRVAHRSQHSGGIKNNHLGVLFLGQGALQGYGLSGVVETWGATTADSGGTSVDPGATADTKGAYSELITTTVRDSKWLVLRIGQNTDIIRSNCRWWIDIAIGAAGSEQIIIPDIQVECWSTSDKISPTNVSLPCNIPAGVRVAARSRCNINTAGDRLFDLTAYGLS
jgi:hypothetical protein